MNGQPCRTDCPICACDPTGQRDAPWPAFRWSPQPRLLQTRLWLPYKRPPKSLVGNARSHWRQKAADTQQVRGDVTRLAQHAGLHKLVGVEHVIAELVWAPGDRRKRDADNLWPLFKVICDSIARGPRRDWVGLDLVPDDSPDHFTKLHPRIAPPPEKGMWLVLTLYLQNGGAA